MDTAGGHDENRQHLVFTQSKQLHLLELYRFEPWGHYHCGLSGHERKQPRSIAYHLGRITGGSGIMQLDLRAVREPNWGQDQMVNEVTKGAFGWHPAGRGMRL